MDDCMEKVKAKSLRATFVMIVVTLLFQIHFCRVIYTHWKRAHLPKSKGGTVPDLAESIEMPNAFQTSQTVATESIQHAIDDEQL